MDSTSLFTRLASAYASSRPTYPPEILALLSLHVPPPAYAVDIAAGTGIFSQCLLQNGYNVTAVEPNPAMRSEIFHSAISQRVSIVAGTAESTGLKEHSADLITIAQAFHWVDPEATRLEFKRIGKPSCLTAVVWNSRNFSNSSFMMQYKMLLEEFAPAYTSMKTHWSNLDVRVKSFFLGKYKYVQASHILSVDEDQMIGNLLSLSYAPPEATPEHEIFINQAREIFSKHQKGGYVQFDLTTHLFTGNL